MQSPASQTRRPVSCNIIICQQHRPLTTSGQLIVSNMRKPRPTSLAGTGQEQRKEAQTPQDACLRAVVAVQLLAHDGRCGPPAAQWAKRDIVVHCSACAQSEHTHSNTCDRRCLFYTRPNREDAVSKLSVADQNGGGQKILGRNDKGIYLLESSG